MQKCLSSIQSALSSIKFDLNPLYRLHRYCYMAMNSSFNVIKALASWKKISRLNYLIVYPFPTYQGKNLCQSMVLPAAIEHCSHSKVMSMNKNEAIKIMNRRNGSQVFDSRNTHFANVNSAKDIWWFDIPTSKAFSYNIPYLHLLLYQNREDEIFHLKIPPSFFIKKRDSFIIREEKGTLSLELSTEKATFLKDVRSGSGQISFKEFLQ